MIAVYVRSATYFVVPGTQTAIMAPGAWPEVAARVKCRCGVSEELGHRVVLHKAP